MPFKVFMQLVPFIETGAIYRLYRLEGGEES